MEENNKNMEVTEEIIENTDTAEEEPMTRRVYTKQQNALYTIISIALFFVLYFGVKGVMGAVNRPYIMYAYPDMVSEERTASIFELSGISSDLGYVFENARLVKNENGYEFMAVFSGIADRESFTESNTQLVNSDSDEEVRIEFYPYRENPDVKDFVYAEAFGGADGEGGTVYLFEWQGRLYAEYFERGNVLPSEISSIMAGQEKIYTEN